MDVMLLEKDNRDTYVSSLETTAKVGKKKIGKISGIVLAEEMCSVPGLGNDILEVLLLRERSTEPSWRDHFVLIPFVPTIVPIVDLKNSMVYLDPPSGLLDLSYTHEEKKPIKGFLPGSAE
jgi:ribosomal 30S subunit maturation factor RimM